MGVVDICVLGIGVVGVGVLDLIAVAVEEDGEVWLAVLLVDVATSSMENPGLVISAVSLYAMNSNVGFRRSGLGNI